jgi:hypothetical protein
MKRGRHVTITAASTLLDRRLLALSVAVQLVLCRRFGHPYDTRISTCTTARSQMRVNVDL